MRERPARFQGAQIRRLAGKPVRNVGQFDAGIHARSAVGVPVLPLDSPVEVEVIVRVGQ